MRLFKRNGVILTFLISMSGLLFSINAAAMKDFISIPQTKNPQIQQTVNLIETYYNALNKKDMNQFFSVIDQNVVHDINQGNTERGIKKFKQFMEKGNKSFNEKLNAIVIMVSDDGKHAAARWIDHGIYYHDYPGMNVAAKNQKYTLSGGHFFEIRHGKIYRITTYYNGASFMQQIKK